MNRAASVLVKICAACVSSVPVAFSSEPTADDYAQYYKRTVGDWRVKVEGEFGNYEQLLSIKLSPTGDCLIMPSSVPDGSRAEMQMLAGYDPASKRWKETAFVRGGGAVTSRIRLEKDSAESQANRVVLETDATVVRPDGRSESGSATWHVAITSPDKIEILVTDTVFDGVKRPDGKITYERLREAIVWENEGIKSKAKPQ